MAFSLPPKSPQAYTGSRPAILLNKIHATRLKGAPDEMFREQIRFLEHERAKSELKALMPEDAKEAIGHGVRARRSKSGAVSFDVLVTEATHAPIQ